MSGSPQPPNALLLSLLNRALESLNRSETAHAERFLLQALSIAPRDPNALQLMGVTRRAQNRIEDAEAFYLQSLAVQPNQPQVHHNLGNLYRAQGQYAASANAQRQAIRLKRDYMEAYAGLALALSAAGEHEEAIAACRQALRMQPANFVIRQILAAEFIDTRRSKDAASLLENLLTEKGLDPGTIAALKFNLALSMRDRGQYEQALETLRAIDEHSRNIPYFHFEVGSLLFQLRKYEDALKQFDKALERRPGDARILASLALTAGYLDQPSQARDFAQKAISADGPNGLARVAIARAELAEGHIKRGCDIVRNALMDRSIVMDDPAISAITDIASFLDKRGEYKAAFSVIEAQNARKRADADASSFTRAIDDTERLRQYFEGSSRWNSSAPSHKTPISPSGHVFVLGFMRSGTTLLASALANHEAILAADEVDFFSETAKTFLVSEGGLDKLAALSDAEIGRWTRRYWEDVAAQGFPVRDKVFVEKMPFNSLRLPLIARLFPEAKIILALRDPRDIVLSCMRQKFELTPFSYEFMDLEDCARFYSSVMKLAERYREVLPLQLEQCRYEDVVTNYDQELRRLCAFIGIDWRESMSRFSGSSGFVNPLSASAQQVRSGLYDSSVGQWRHYKDQLAPALPFLSPWISKLRYPAE